MTPSDPPTQGTESGPAQALLRPDEHVLSTLEADGSRRWLFPRLAKGRFWKRRRVVAYLLLLLYSGLPWIQIAGQPAMLLDIPNRRFVLFGATFLPSDTVSLALFVLLIFLAVFLMTAVAGRVWCGWACPQTVYMEFVFRPIERLFMGRAGTGGAPKKKLAGWRKPAMYLVYLVVCLHLAQTFVAYFAGVESVRTWMWHSPANHPIAFAVMAAITVAMMVDFAFWREQLCILGCPYGRLQSVLLDRSSLIVGYDTRRGEPRGHLRKGASEAESAKQGDCVDCGLCVAVCPTGIDIRSGLQMECIHCTQCADACDHVMAKVGRPLGLIRYSSQAAMDNEAVKVVRPRLVVYMTALIVLFALLVGSLAKKPDADVTLLRALGAPFVMREDGLVQNTMRLKVKNRTDADRVYVVELIEPTVPGVTLTESSFALGSDKTETETLVLLAEPHLFQDGPLDTRIVVRDDLGWSTEKSWKLLGPRQAIAPRTSGDQP